MDKFTEEEVKRIISDALGISAREPSVPPRDPVVYRLFEVCPLSYSFILHSLPPY